GGGVGGGWGGGGGGGVRLQDRRRRQELVPAEREVLLCAGALNTPQILLLSGIGPGGDLDRAGVPVRHDLPGVGRNLQDHPCVTLLWEVSDQHTLYRAEKPRFLAEW